MMSFTQLGLSLDLVKSLEEAKYNAPYPVQEKVIPLVLERKDIMAIAQTGSGKTAAFVLPVLQLLQHQKASLPRHVKVLVLVPTRELAMQSGSVFEIFGKNLPTRIKTVSVYGGVNINNQIDDLQKCEVLVATPGRLLDLMASRSVFLNQVEILILDEADKMLNLGFKEEMNDIFYHLPAQRQNILLSATLNDNIDILKSILLNNPVLVEIEPEEENLDLITQSAYKVAEEKKGVILRYLIKTNNFKQVLIFTSSTKRADNVTVKLNKNGIEAAAIHGDKTQAARTDALNKFKEGKLRVLVATDLVSRGIDIQSLPVVINYELPRSPTDYVHRIGRTGRAGVPGQAISLITPIEEAHFKVIQKKMKRKVELLESENFKLEGF